MHIDQRKEQYSFAYVRAVAAAAGYKVMEPGVDDESVDLVLSGRSKLGTPRKPILDVQAKCLGDDTFDGGSFGYPLKLKNYDDLRIPAENLTYPRILVVVRAPQDDAQWLAGGDDGLLMRHCGYWCSLRGMPAYDGQAKPGNERRTVRLPRAQRFDVDGLRAMMQGISKGQEHWP